MKFLIIQTAFLGDVILATAVAEKLHSFYPEAGIDFLLRKGNEAVLENHSFIREVIIIDKRTNKFRNLFRIAGKVRKEKYDYVINLQRFASSGFIVWRSGAKAKIGFDKNPFSFCYTKKVKHEIGKGKHEVERNQQLIDHLTDSNAVRPRIYPSEKDFESVKSIHSAIGSEPYVCIAPASVWFTKQFPKEKWIELAQLLPEKLIVYLIGAPADFELCEEIKIAVIKSNSTAPHQIINLAGKLRLTETAALMKNAAMNYVNDSAPLHIASSMNAPTTAVYCSTIPAFGFGPLADQSKIVETTEPLTCRPCGLHGYNQCPLGHFRCAYSISVKEMLTK